MTDLAQRLANLSPAQRAALTARLTPAADRPAVPPIAIIGVACRLPGGATSPEAFWRNLIDGVDAIKQIPADRWTPSSTLGEAGPIKSSWGGFLDDIDQFDRGFFGLSPREAAYMDPQQRLLLETAWEALEDAGQMTEHLAQSATGVFVGAQSHSSDYYQLQTRGELDTYSATGTAHSILANRLSFLLDLRGPSMAIDTACSSSLVAVHQACQSLRGSETDMALAGGVNLILTPDFHGCLSMMEMMAPDGRCKTFDHRANGFVRAEGCGIVVLKRLADAERDGDPIIAVILGSAVNQDGASNGLTAPNGLSQQAVIRRALETAKVAANEVAYVETHGTGTELGDPIEVEALATVLRSDADQASPCVLGALKSNIGHLEAASGIAGLIKVALCLKNEAIPGNLHLEAVNPHLIDHIASFTLPSAPIPWKRTEERRVAGVSSFGFGGTNAHVVLAEAPYGPHIASGSGVPTPQLLPFSARSDQALRALADRYTVSLSASDTSDRLEDLSYTAARRRLHHDHRLCVVGSSAAQWAASLRHQLAERQDVSTAGGPSDIVFVFSGQGGQRPQAGQQLLESEPVFYEAVAACEAALRKHAPIALIEEMRAPKAKSRLHRADIGQPAHVALQIGLDTLWRSWGIQPAMVIGHSIGEIAAAHGSGALSLDDAMTIAFHRGRILQAATGLGGMAMIGLSADETTELIAKKGSQISISAFNSPMSCIVSGPVASLEALVQEAQDRAVFARMLDPDYPSHSPFMDRFATDLEAALAGVRPKAPQISILSTVTSSPSDRGAFDAGYWAHNLRLPVLFAQAIDTAVQAGSKVFLEISPQPVLRAPIEQCETHASGPLVVATSLDRDQPDRTTMLEGVATLYRAGANPDWAKLAPRDRHCVALPRYPWDRQRYWLAPPLSDTVARHDVQAATEPFTAAWLYDLVWQDSALQPESPSALASVNLVSSAVSLASLVETLAPVRKDDAPMRAWLDITAARYVLETFRALGVDISIGTVWRDHEFLLALVQPRFDRLLRRMLGILIEQTIVIEEGAGWRVVGSARAAPDRFLSTLDDKTAPAPTLLQRCGPHLADVLRGEVEPLSLLFAGENAASAEAIYRDAAPSLRSNSVLKAAIEQWLATRSVDQPIRILEIGAGTGATTQSVLTVLPKDQCDYVFTDVSALFLRQAAERFADFPFVRYELFDVEQDPAAQGFETSSFDLVIAANVLHATCDLTTSLAHVRDLLADDGVIALVECTTARPWMDLTFGLTDGWWRFTDLARRSTHPLLEKDQWVALLGDCGFDDACAVALQNAHGDPMFDQAMLLGRCTAARRLDESASHGSYLIIDEGCPTAKILTEQLQTRGDTCLLVTTASPDFPQRLIDAGDDTKVIYFAGRAGIAFEDQCANLLRTTQALLRPAGSRSGGLWVVTEGCQPGNVRKESSPQQALLWGFGRGISLEAPDLAPMLVDLDPALNADDQAKLMLRELDHEGGEDQILLRGTMRQVPRVQPLATDELVARPLRVEGRHLITGGLGGIGSQLALQLAHAGADELVLVVNRALPDRSTWEKITEKDQEFNRIDTVRRLEAKGVKVSVEALDLRDAKALPNLFVSPAMAGSTLKGVWHAAMLLAPQDLEKMDQVILADTIAVKARAAAQLDELTRAHDIDQFVLFSSTTGLWGARGLAHYASANAFLDALAHQRRSAGLPATAINWGTWEIIERLTPDQRSEAARAGLRPMKAPTAFAALEQVVASRRAQTIVADVDWSRFKTAYEARRHRPLLEQIQIEAPAADPQHLMEPANTVLSGLSSLASSTDRVDGIRALVKHNLAQVLGLDPDEPIDRNRGFFELGMDSLTSVQLRRRLEGAVKRSLSTTVAFRYPTIDSLSEHICDLLFPADRAEALTKAPPAAARQERCDIDQDDASEDELFELLAARLSPGGATND